MPRPPMAEIAWLGLQANRHIYAMGFRNRLMCEREVFRHSNGYHVWDDAIDGEPVSNSSEVRFCLWPRGGKEANERL